VPKQIDNNYINLMFSRFLTQQDNQQLLWDPS